MTQNVVELVVKGDKAISTLDQIEDGAIAAGKAVDDAASATARFEAEQRRLDAAMKAGAGVMPQRLARISAEQRGWESLGRAAGGVHALMTRQAQEAQRAAVLASNAVLTGIATREQATERLLAIDMRHAAALADARGEAIAYAGALDKVAASTNKIVAANDNAGRARRQVLGYQAFDIAQGAVMGAPLAMIAAQQGPQIAQLYAQQGGLNLLWKDTISILGGLARAAGPWIAAAGVMYGAYQLLSSFGSEARIVVDDVTQALAAQAAPLGTVEGMINDLASVQKNYSEAITATADAQNAATAGIIANSEREFLAKQKLLELEAKRQRAALEVQRAEIANAAADLRRAAGGSGETRMDLERRGFADSRIGSVPFVRLPDEITDLNRTLEILANNPAADTIAELRAKLDLSEIAAGKLEEALKLTFNTAASGASLARQRVDEFGNSLASLSKIAAPTLSSVQQATEAFQGALRSSTTMEQELAATLEFEAALKRISAGALTDLNKKLRDVQIGGMSDRDGAAARIRDEWGEYIAGMKANGAAAEDVARATAGMNAELAQSSKRFSEIGARDAAAELRQFASTADGLLEQYFPGEAARREAEQLSAMLGRLGGQLDDVQRAAVQLRIADQFTAASLGVRDLERDTAKSADTMIDLFADIGKAAADSFAPTFASSEELDAFIEEMLA